MEKDLTSSIADKQQYLIDNYLGDKIPKLNDIIKCKKCGGYFLVKNYRVIEVNSVRYIVCANHSCNGTMLDWIT